MKPRNLLLVLVFSMALVACEKSFQTTEETPVEGTFILNNGNMNANDSNIGIYDPSSKTFSPDVFFAVNNQKLGDLGQDIIACGEELYISVNGSKTIFVTDKELKIKTQITAEKDGITLSPKYLATIGSKVYVSYYEGYLGEISQGRSVRLCQVGVSPEGIAAADGKIYVADSGGALYPEFGNTVSVVSVEDFTLKSTIRVNDNPVMLVPSSDGSEVYLLTRGNYNDLPPKIQRISTATNSVQDLDIPSVSAIAKGPADMLYILCAGYDENWNQLPGTVLKYDMKQHVNLDNFVTDGTVLDNAYSISATMDGYVYVGCSDYVNTGDMYVFTPVGTLYDKFDSQGLNPLLAY